VKLLDPGTRMKAHSHNIIMLFAVCIYEVFPSTVSDATYMHSTLHCHACNIHVAAQDAIRRNSNLTLLLLMAETFKQVDYYNMILLHLTNSVSVKQISKDVDAT